MSAAAPPAPAPAPASPAPGPASPSSPHSPLPPRRWRVPVTVVAVFGLGALVALAAGAILWLGFGSAVQSTRTLLQERSETVLDTLEHRLRGRLEPISQQARWIAARVAEGAVDVEAGLGGGGEVGRVEQARLDAFMFGALAATPQLAGMGIFGPDGRGRTWYRGSRAAVREDRSDDPQLLEWLRARERGETSSWQDPFWLDTLDTAVVLHDSPLRRADGGFVGMLGQVVPVSELSQDLVAQVSSVPGLTPFILYRGRQVLAHPQLIHWSPPGTGADHPLATLDELGDPVLEGLGTAARREGRWLVRSRPGVEVAWVVLSDVWHLVLRRELPSYGGGWTVGVHRSARVDGGALERMVWAGGAGLAVLVAAVLVAVLVGRRISRPVRAIAAAARVVEANRLDEVRPLRANAILEMDDANRSFNQMVEGLRERQVIRRTLGRFIPEEVAHALLSAGGRIEPAENRATVLFCDLVGFTTLTETLGPAGVVAVLNDWFSRMTAVIEHHGGTVIQFQGDGLLAAFNAPVAHPAHARAAVEAALEMRAAVRGQTFAGQSLRCRTGIGTGPVVAGAVGAAGRLSYTVYGDAVNLAARLEALNREHGTTLLLCGETADAIAADADADAGAVADVEMETEADAGAATEAGADSGADAGLDAATETGADADAGAVPPADATAAGQGSARTPSGGPIPLRQVGAATVRGQSTPTRLYTVEEAAPEG